VYAFDAKITYTLNREKRKAKSDVGVARNRAEIAPLSATNATNAHTYDDFR